MGIRGGGLGFLVGHWGPPMPPEPKATSLRERITDILAEVICSGRGPAGVTSGADAIIALFVARLRAEAEEWEKWCGEPRGHDPIGPLHGAGIITGGEAVLTGCAPWLPKWRSAMPTEAQILALAYQAIDEEEELEGTLPAQVRIAIMERGIEETLRATVRVTKRNIHARLAALIEKIEKG